MHLLKHLAAQFPGLPLEPPLFHNWTVALRFEHNIKRDNPPDFGAIVRLWGTLTQLSFRFTACSGTSRRCLRPYSASINL